jgi:hypothetical protein
MLKSFFFYLFFSCAAVAAADGATVRSCERALEKTFSPDAPSLKKFKRPYIHFLETGENRPELERFFKKLTPEERNLFKLNTFAEHYERAPKIKKHSSSEERALLYFMKSFTAKELLPLHTQKILHLTPFSQEEIFENARLLAPWITLPQTEWPSLPYTLYKSLPYREQRIFLLNAYVLHFQLLPPTQDSLGHTLLAVIAQPSDQLHALLLPETKRFFHLEDTKALRKSLFSVYSMNDPLMKEAALLYLSVFFKGQSENLSAWKKFASHLTKDDLLLFKRAVFIDFFQREPSLISEHPEERALARASH